MAGDTPGGPLTAGRIKRIALSGGAGLLIGVGLGAALGSVGMGVALGLFIGLLIGVSTSRRSI